MAESILHKVDIDWLLCVYGPMLTEKQRDIATLYYEEDFSLAEIAQQENVSRQSIHDTLQRVEKQLRSLEEKLGLRQRIQAVEGEIQAALQTTPSACSESRAHMEKALRLLNDEEESNGL